MDDNKKLALAALVILLGGNASNLFSTFNPTNYRPDPFTGLDGAKMKAELKSEISNLLVRLSVAEIRVQDCMSEHDHGN